MAKIYTRIIESSSKGNCIVLYDGNSHLFLDFGCKPKYIKNYINKYCVQSTKIAGILITHYHVDHVLSLKESLLDNNNFYMSDTTKLYLKKNLKINKEKNVISFSLNNNKKWIKISNYNWKFKFVQTIHNAEGSVAFIIKNKGNKILYLTDTEYIENKLFKKCTHYIIECNYGNDFIECPHKNSKHIQNKINHMNIFDLEKFLGKYLNKKTQQVLVSHLSATTIDFEFIKLLLIQIKKIYPKIICDFLNPNEINKISY